MRTVTVLLTKYSDWISDIIYHIGGRGYTHASLALEEDASTYYSFNFRGFCMETMERHRQRGVKKSLSCQLQVSEQAYQNMKADINNFKARQPELKYTRFGVFCCIMKIPFHRKKHYFCSQFVAELLKHSGAVPLKRDPALYLPNHFCRELAESGQLVKIQYNPV